MFLFTEDCLVGIEEIDNEHRHLFELLNKGLYLLQNQYVGDQYYAIKELLAELEAYADRHFAYEEAYMQQIRDPELILQRPQHMMFREKILELNVKNIDDFESQIEAIDGLINFLAKWLYQHIIGSDSMIGKLPPLEEWMLRENPCEFVPEYETGIDIIDKEHRILFEIAERTNQLVRSYVPGDGYEKITAILTELKDYTKLHFADEEEYMQSIHYEGYEAQKRAHEAFIARLNEIDVEDIVGDPKEYLESLMEFLLGWLVNHILRADKEIPAK